MIIHFYGVSILCWILSAFALLSSAQNIDSSECNRSCGSKRVQYPFGFSDQCQIKLNCNKNSGTISVGDFLVQNFTSDRIFITLPSACNRPIAEIDQLFGENFAPTWRNGFLLKNCSSNLDGCVRPSRFTWSGFNFGACRFGGRNDKFLNTSCYSTVSDDEMEFFDDKTVFSRGNCNVLYSSIMVENSSSAIGSSSVNMQFQTAELGWWIAGECNCDPNAACTRVSNGLQHNGFRCNCNEGYSGDGFNGQGGCRKVPDCRASWYDSGGCGRNKISIIIGGSFAGLSLVVALVFICYYVKKRSTTLRSLLVARRLISEAVSNSSVPSYPYKEIEKATNGFSENQRLGNGAYGTVYAGKLHSDEWVAIKKLKHRDHESVEQVKNEIKLLSSVSHPNLVRLIGCCMEKGEQILVYEFMPNGTLSQHLQRERGTVLPWTVRLNIASETAQAIAYLHSAMSPPIYHRDVKSSNILLDSNFNSKVADFGLSRYGMTDDSHISTAPQGTPGYVDPQYHQNFHLSDKSDVYSFGVVLVEIISAMKVVDFSRPHSEINLAALAIDRIGKGRIDEMIDPYLEPHRDAWTLTSVHKMAEIAFRCLAFHRDMRPSMIEVVNELEQIRHSSCAQTEENTYLGSSVASSCSSPYHKSEQSLSNTTIKETRVKSWKLNVPHRALYMIPAAEHAEDCSPISLQNSWLSDQSSPSSSSLLANGNR